MSVDGTVLPRADGPMVPSPYRLRRRRRETAETMTLELEPVGASIPRWAPGQFNMLCAFGIGEIPISASGDPSDGEVLVHTVRDVGAVSHALCSLRPGAILGARGPFGTRWDVASAAGGDVVIVAGGIGLAPLRPAILEILANRDRYRQVSVLVGARSPDLLLYPRQLHRWRSRFDTHVDVTVDAADETWNGRVGVVGDLLSTSPFDPQRATALVCGPEVMIRFTAAALLDRGVPPSRVRVSLERNMKCAISQCGHCQLGPFFVCSDGPVFTWEAVAPWLGIREL